MNLNYLGGLYEELRQNVGRVELVCGIMGYVGGNQAAPIVLDGLGRLEYRGYDSAGIAVLRSSGGFSTHKAVGKLSRLREMLETGPPAGRLGVGHTRWATHGPANLSNSHPHFDCSGKIAVVHNGIVENYSVLKSDLTARGHRFVSQTDTEVIPHLIEQAIESGSTLEDAVREILGRVRGALALLVASEQHPDTLVAVRNGNAGGLVVGQGYGEAYVASDLVALASRTQTVKFINAGEVAIVRPGEVRLETTAGDPVDRGWTTIPQDPRAAARGVYKHFMMKEMMEQPEALTDALRGRVDLATSTIHIDGLDGIAGRLNTVRRVILTGCGTSYHAALVGRHYFESLCHLPVEVEVASELRYRDISVSEDDLVISLTQSGETADTLGVIEKLGQFTDLQVVITNVPGSQATRLATASMEMRAGLEIGVASTKTFTSSLMCLYLFALHLGEQLRTMNADDLTTRLHDVARLPRLVSEVLDREKEVERIARHFLQSNHFLFIGRGLTFPIALEGALKLKELSYLHAEGFAAGELKHGPIALIDAETPTFAVAPTGSLKAKIANNIEEINARGGKVVGLLTDGDTELIGRLDHVIFIPDAPAPLVPIIAAVPTQQFAYHMGSFRGADVDQPRNLAKSVTVE